MIYKLTEKGKKLLHVENRTDLVIDISPPFEGNLVGELSLRLTDNKMFCYWLAVGPLAIKTLLDLGLIQEIKCP